MRLPRLSDIAFWLAMSAVVLGSALAGTEYQENHRNSHPPCTKEVTP